MKINNIVIIKIFFLLLFTVNTYKSAFSDVIKKIEVNGNDRLAEQTIILFTELNVDDNIDTEDLNQSFKKLFETDYFNDVKISFNDGVLKINVVENPLIQSIKIEGIKNKSIEDDLSKITKKIEKYPYLENKVKDQKNTLLNIIRSNGFYFAEIQTIIIDNNNNSVNIIYKFNLGERAKISEIKFIGNKIFKNNKLRNIIVSEETKPWKFLTTNKYLDEGRINLDVNLLENYFRNKGYYNVAVKSSSAKIIDKNNFVLTFNIDSGKKYYFNNVDLKVTDSYSKENFSNLIGKTF